MSQSPISESRQVQLDSHALATRREGIGPREFVCLHGLVDTLAVWDRIAPALAERGRLIRFDQRGHGASGTPPGPYRREDLAADVVALMDAHGVEKAILLGHSMGGIVSMATALAHADRIAGLVLIGTASHCNEKTADWYEKIARAGERDGCAGLAGAIYGDSATREVRGDAQGISHVTRMLKSLHSDPLTDRLAGITCPVLMLVGEKDPMGPRASERIAEALPSGAGTLEVVPGCGHWLHVQAHEVVVEALDRWLAKAGI